MYVFCFEITLFEEKFNWTFLNWRINQIKKFVVIFFLLFSAIGNKICIYRFYFTQWYYSAWSLRILIGKQDLFLSTCMFKDQIKICRFFLINAGTYVCSYSYFIELDSFLAIRNEICIYRCKIFLAHQSICLFVPSNIDSDLSISVNFYKTC